MSIFSKWFSNKGADSAAKAEPKKPQLSAADYCEQGQKMLNEGKLMQAMEYFQAAIELDKHFEKAYLHLSKVYEKQGKPDKAKAALYALLAVDPNNKKALVILQGELPNGNVIQTDSPTTTIVQPIPSYHRPFSADYDLCVGSGRNRFYFRIVGYEAIVVGPNRKKGNDNYWEGFKEPEGELSIPSKVEFQGSQYPVTTIGEDAFWRCYRIRTVAISETVKVIEAGAFHSCKNLISVSLPDSLVEIGDGAFSSCAFVSINIPSSVKKIGKEAFKYSKIGLLVIPNGVQCVDSSIFHYCDSLTSIVIPPSVTHLTGYWSDYGLHESFTMIMEGHPPAVSSMAEGTKVEVPDRMMDEYRNAQYWQCCNLLEKTERRQILTWKIVGWVVGAITVGVLIGLYPRKVLPFVIGGGIVWIMYIRKKK